jgi:hypothetical protein
MSGSTVNPREAWKVRMFERDGGRWFCVENAALYIDFMEEWAWTIRNITYLEDEIVGEYGAHGSVVRMDTGTGRKDYYYIGTSHGHEVVRRFVILVDGVELDYETGAECSGSEVVICKDSGLGPFDYEDRITFPASGDRITHQHTYRVVADLSQGFSFLFAFMHEFGSAFDQWRAVLAAGQVLEGVIPNRGEGGLSLESDVLMVTLYDQTAQKGVTLTYPEVYRGAGPVAREAYHGTTGHFGNVIVDRKQNNKFYFRPEVREMGYEVGDSFSFRVEMLPFSANPDGWRERARELERRAGDSGSE